MHRLAHHGFSHGRRTEPDCFHKPVIEIVREGGRGLIHSVQLPKLGARPVYPSIEGNEHAGRFSCRGVGAELQRFLAALHDLHGVDYVVRKAEFVHEDHVRRADGPFGRRLAAHPSHETVTMNASGRWSMWTLADGFLQTFPETSVASSAK